MRLDERRENLEFNDDHLPCFSDKIVTRPQLSIDSKYILSSRNPILASFARYWCKSALDVGRCNKKKDMHIRKIETVPVALSNYFIATIRGPFYIRRGEHFAYVLNGA